MMSDPVYYSGMRFQLKAPFQPTGDQPAAIKKLVSGIESNKQHQTLLGVTGSGKSLGFTEPVLITELHKNQSLSKATIIGTYIDTLFQQHSQVIKTYHDSQVLYLNDCKFQLFTQSFDPSTGESKLAKISALTRHKAPTEMFQVSTRCGRSAVLTGDHSVWVLRNGQLILTDTKSLTPNDHVPIPGKLDIKTGVANYTLDVLTTLANEKLYVDAIDSIQKYIEQNNKKKLATILQQIGINSPDSRIRSMLNHRKGRGIRANLFLQLLANTNYLGNNWNPLTATIGAKSAAHRLPTQICLTAEWLRFMGYYLAEGCSQNRYILIANQDTEIRNTIMQFIQKLQMPFIIRASSDIQISSVTLTLIIKYHFGTSSHNKKLPEFWPQLPKDDLGVLLSAYFDGDGTVGTNGEVIATTKSDQLASDLLYALLSFGIYGRIQKKWKRATNSRHTGYWYNFVTISGATNLRLFHKNIGFSLAYKQVKLGRFITRLENTNIDLIPNVGTALKDIRTNLQLSQSTLAHVCNITRSSISLIEHNHRNPSRQLYKRIVKYLKETATKKSGDSEILTQIVELEKLSKVRWSPITTVKQISYKHSYVYDFTVPGTETFFGGTGGFFVHNTFTMASVIQEVQQPTLIIAHNKTLAAQLYQEFRDFFPDNAVSYFVSYYDYYQPEAYIPSTDTYIEKEATINDEIDKLRLSTTTNLLTRPDTIVVASVSCIYNLGSPVEYGRYILELVEGQRLARETLLLQFANLQYERSTAELYRGSYRIRGDMIQLWPAYEDRALRIETLENRITEIRWIDPVTGSPLPDPKGTPDTPSHHRFIIYPAKHYVVNPKTQEQGIAEIAADLEVRVKQLQAEGKIVEAYRLQQKVNYDLDMIREFGFTNGIENYSRYFDGRQPGEAPFSLLDYFRAAAAEHPSKQFLTIIDESHITLPQIRGMYFGDNARKKTLIDYGFRLPSAIDNRPLKFEEFMQRTDSMVYVSATPDEYEVSLSGNQTVEQLIRPTGLIDPNVELRPSDGQIEDLVLEIMLRKAKGQRVLVTTLTKKMAEALTEYLNEHEKIDKLLRRSKDALEQDADSDAVLWNEETLPIDSMEIGKIDSKFFSHIRSGRIERAHFLRELDIPPAEYPKVSYLHSDVETLERSDILDDLRRGVYDVVVGINLLREGLDLPEVTLVAILDADKEGFLRSRTSLIQTLGRAARHVEGHAILYADKLTKSMRAAISETLRRRSVQSAFNEQHGIEATTISKPIREKMISSEEREQHKLRRGRPGIPTEKPKEEGTIVLLSKGEKIDLSKVDPAALTPYDRKQLATKLRRRMNEAVKVMDFELAAMLRDVINELS